MISSRHGQLLPGRERRAVRAGARTLAVSAIVLAAAVVTSPAYAETVGDDKRDDGDDPGASISTLEVIGVFGVIPIAAFALIWLVVSLPSMMRGPRYRPGQNWTAQSQWIGAPGAEVSSGGGAYDTPALGKGAPALSGRVLETEPPATPGDGGGTSARW
ncbi:MAG: hypothetical protein ACT4PP_07930 [Sporichthyaceae bacterium]